MMDMRSTISAFSAEPERSTEAGASSAVTRQAGATPQRQACWISPPLQAIADASTPPTIFRRSVWLERDIVCARIHATALGVYALRLNGKPVSEDILNPGWTSYRHRLQYQSYDVTDLLNQGENVLAATLTDGWFRGPLFMENRRNTYGPRTGVLVQLEIDFADGRREIVVSDTNWSCSTGGLRLAEIQHGESWDFRLEPEDWMLPGFDDSHWETPDELAPGTSTLVPQAGPPMRRIETLEPISIDHRVDVSTAV